jgi:hypothetical protein
MKLLGGVLFVAAIILVAVVFNRLLDKFEIANEPALTIEQRKEKAQLNQYEWDHYSYRR